MFKIGFARSFRFKLHTTADFSQQKSTMAIVARHLLYDFASLMAVHDPILALYIVLVQDVCHCVSMYLLASTHI